MIKKLTLLLAGNKSGGDIERKQNHRKKFSKNIKKVYTWNNRNQKSMDLDGYLSIQKGRERILHSLR